ncbi:hypothetical protein [Tenacibaculum ovolyticum]|uniref:hypothetical protein n=1 Tax=Tenacibaculum ovolyticum TaxID=104270 RepID=UPI0007EC8640|nr:hypothetical protein [Tenacibaculum ovolyticum]
MTKFRNYNQGRVKELIENALREASSELQVPEIGPPYNFEEFDNLPKKNIFDDSKSISIKCYNTETGEILALCTIRERYLKLIHDGELSDRKHEYNLFRKYAVIVSKQVENGTFTLCKTELTSPENCTCECCYPTKQIDNSDRYTIEDNFRDGFEGNMDAWNHANQ